MKIMKRANDIYAIAPPATWLKIRNPDYTQIRDRHEMLKSIEPSANRVAASS